MTASDSHGAQLKNSDGGARFAELEICAFVISECPVQGMDLWEAPIAFSKVFVGIFSHTL